MFPTSTYFSSNILGFFHAEEVLLAEFDSPLIHHSHQPVPAGLAALTAGLD